MKRLILLSVCLVGCMGQCFDNMPTSAPPMSDEVPLCGNGILDANEVCDDGNRQGGDGCNAYCSAFDAMTTTCTLAGQNMPCPFGKPQVNGIPSQAVFCNLRALDANGSYVIVADMGTLLRLELFTDSVTTSLTRLPVSTTYNLQPICSLAILPSDGSLLIHECENTVQRLQLVSPNGQTATVLATLHASIKPATSPFQAYYDKADRYAVLAGETVAATTQCVQVWTVTAAGVSTLFAEIPCTIYNVWASAAVTYPSYSITGMHPRRIHRESCPRRMQQTGSLQCYAVILERNDMLLLTVYIHVEGGIDMGYFLSTNTMDNALGIPIVHTVDNVLYTSLGTCFMMESRIITSKGTAPPLVTLGNACKNVPEQGLLCATPLNNPFSNDIMSSPYLLPQGLSVTHTHSELSTIFSSTCSLNNNNNTSGPLLYQSILRNTYANTTPIDFVPLPASKDIVYITRTSIGLITTKRTHFTDKSNPGYCRATNLLYCPHGYFGSVGSVCASCTNTHHPMYGKSVAWQIKCAGLQTTPGRRLLLAQTPPHERLSMIVAGDPYDTTIPTVIHDALTSYTVQKGSASAPRQTFVSPLQQYNMDADRLTSLYLTPTSSLVECLIAATENRTQRSFLKNKTSGEGAEFASTILSYSSTDSPILTAMAIVTQPNLAASSCRASMLQRDPLQGWLSCVAFSQTANTTSSTRRRLLQTTTAANGVKIYEHQGTTLASNTVISWQAETTNVLLWDLMQTNTTTPAASADQASFPIWAAAVTAAGGLVVLIFILYLFYHYSHSHKKKKATMP